MSTKRGYSGTAILMTDKFEGGKPLKVTFDFHKEDYHSDEGRITTLHFKSFILVAVYVPNSGIPILRRLDYRVN